MIFENSVNSTRASEISEMFEISGMSEDRCRIFEILKILKMRVRISEVFVKSEFSEISGNADAQNSVLNFQKFQNCLKRSGNR